MDIYVHGADTETYYGRPMTLQFFSDDMHYETCLWVNENNATTAFFDEWLNTLPRHCLHVVYVHNLAFDLPEFLWDVKEELITPGGEFSFEVDEWHVHGVYAQPTFCRFTNRKTNRQVLMVDSMLWYQGSLDAAAKLFCPELPKLKRIKNLGTKKFRVNDDAFYDYAMRDAEVAYHIGKSVQAIIREFDIRQPVSLADMAAKIFRHHFLIRTIPQPSMPTIKGALASYHGGKNNVLPEAKAAWHEDVTGIDISSAYPYAMAQLPSMSYANLYKRYKRRHSHPKSVPWLGVYCISGTAKECRWPVLFYHGFDPVQGKFRNVWVQGIELNEALRSGEVNITSIRGYYYEAEKDDWPSPFRQYVNNFYKLKQAQDDKVWRHMYKILLNALYGKFIQTRKNSRVIYTDVESGETEETHDLVAGGMFHPFIASAITAHTRAYMHQVEHAHKAIHTATDGIYTYAKRIKKVPLAPSNGLGSLEVEARGTLVLLRNKCYILYGDKPLDKTSIKSQYFRGKYILKYAKHGFQGTIYDLEKLVAHNKRKYKASRPHRLREAMKRGLNVNEFVERPYNLRVPPLKIGRRPG